MRSYRRRFEGVLALAVLVGIFIGIRGDRSNRARREPFTRFDNVMVTDMGGPATEPWRCQSTTAVTLAHSREYHGTVVRPGEYDCFMVTLTRSGPGEVDIEIAADEAGFESALITMDAASFPLLVPIVAATSGPLPFRYFVRFTFRPAAGFDVTAASVPT